MSKVYRGELVNPYVPGSTLFWQWAAEANMEAVRWFQDLLIRFKPGHAPRVGEPIIGKRYRLDDGEVERLRARIEELKMWISVTHEVVHVTETKCNGVMCLVDEEDLDEILDRS